MIAVNDETIRPFHFFQSDLIKLPTDSRPSYTCGQPVDNMRSQICFVLLVALALSVVAQKANEKLKKCCSKLTKEDKECVQKFCDFEAISQTSVLNYLSTCTERGTTVGRMWDCASSRHDHTECCKAKGVEGKCLEYCAAQDGVPVNYFDYLSCLEDFNNIRDCFRDYLEDH